MGQLIYVEAPNQIPLEYKEQKIPIVFLAGGITGCSEWQTELVEILRKYLEKLPMARRLIVINPRRANFPIHDKNAASAQVKWEFEMLRKANIISFWFDKDQIQPIVLFELGAHSMRAMRGDKIRLCIGVHPQYPRLLDVQYQMQNLFGIDIFIKKSLYDLANAISLEAWSFI